MSGSYNVLLLIQNNSARPQMLAKWITKDHNILVLRVKVQSDHHSSVALLQCYLLSRQKEENSLPEGTCTLKPLVPEGRTFITAVPCYILTAMKLIYIVYTSNI